MSLGTLIATGRTCNLDALRLVLASCVIMSHAWPLALGPGTAEPLDELTGRSLGGWAVLLFFYLSGLLVTQSAERKSWPAFWRARFKRVFPGLSVALIFTLVLAFLGGAVPDMKEAMLWFLRAITLISIEHQIAGAFAANPYPGVVNGPLWSLFHEIVAYGFCILLVRAGLTRWVLAPAGFALVLGIASCFDGVFTGRVAVFIPLFFAFLLGMATYRLAHFIPMRPMLVVVAVVAATVLPGPGSIVAVCIAMLAGALCLPPVALRADYSYGLYIYGWPVAQCVLHMVPGMGPYTLAVTSLAATLPFAMFSWHFIEAPITPRRTAEV